MCIVYHRVLLRILQVAKRRNLEKNKEISGKNKGMPQ